MKKWDIGHLHIQIESWAQWEYERDVFEYYFFSHEFDRRASYYAIFIGPLAICYVPGGK